MTRLLTTRRPAAALGLCRIAVGLAALARGLKSGRDLYLLNFVPDVVPARLFDWVPAVDAAWQVALFGGIWIVAALGLTLGYRARLCAGVVLVAAVAQQVFAGLVVFSLLVFGIYVLFLDDGTVERGRVRVRRILLRVRGAFAQPIGQV